MSAIAVIEAAPIVAPDGFQEWLLRLRDLFDQRRDVHWAISDCLVEGKKAKYLTQIGLDLLSEELGVAPRTLKDCLKAGESFPPAIRNVALSVEHHATLSNIPKDQALPLLQKADTDHLSVNDLREAVTLYRYSTGELFADDDVDTSLATLITRAWNRATPQARECFLARAVLANFGIIDEDEAIHDAE